MPYFDRFVKKHLRFRVSQPLLSLGLGLAILCGSSFLSSGCHSAATQKEATTIKFSTWGSAEEMTVLKKLLHSFEQTHPRIHVDVIHIPDNYFQKLHILIAGGLAPDVMFINSLNYPLYANNHVFKPLAPFLAHDAALQTNTFYPSALQAFTWRQQLYAIPRDVSDLVVYYNADLFKRAHLATPSANWTLDDMLYDAKALTADTDHDGSRDQFGISFFGKPPLLWLPFVWSQGGELFNQDLSAFKLTSPQAMNALQWYAGLRHKWHVAPLRKEVGSVSMSQLFLQGKLAMLISGRWSVPILRQQAKFQWDIVPFPQGQGGSVVGIDASGYALSNTSTHPEAGWELIRFLSSHESQRAFAQSGLIVPARKDVANSPDFLSAPPAHGAYFLTATAHGQPSHTPTHWNEIAESLGLALEPVWESGKPVKEVLPAMKPKIEALLQDD